MLNRLPLALPLLVVPALAVAQPAPQQVTALVEAMGLDDILMIMREEGLLYGDEIATDLLPNGTSPNWQQAVSEIYDVAQLRDGVETRLGAALGDADVAQMIAFFESDIGSSIVTLEVEARRALMDADVEAASKEIAAAAAIAETDRYALIAEYADSNDLIEANVVGALNANYAFYVGLMDGGAFPQEMTQEQIITDVWNQEPEIRESTTEWVFGYLMMAYQPLEDDQLQTYVDFSKSAVGQDLNAALFASFDVMFEEISHALGYAASQHMIGQDL